MKNIWFISDPHFGHENSLTWRDDEDKVIRDFHSIAELNGTIMKNWNDTVKEDDTVYVLGDVAWGLDNLLYLKALKGKKFLVRGNHDNMWNIRKFLDVFDDVFGVKPMVVDGFKFVLSHVPIHTDSLDRWGYNIHGHLHHNIVTKVVLNTKRTKVVPNTKLLEWPDDEFIRVPDPRYINVSVEQINYTPISLNEIKAKLKS